MGKRPRTPHFISGIGDGNVNLGEARGPNDDLFVMGSRMDRAGSGNTANNGRYVRSRNERLMRLEQPLMASEQWRDVFGSGDPAMGKPSPTLSGPWQVSAFILLGIVVVISAIFVHLVSDNHSEPTSPYSYRKRQRHARRMYKTRKKKTDEWSDDEEDYLQNGAGLPDNPTEAGEEAQFFPYYYQQPPVAGAQHFATQEHRLRRTTAKDPNTPPAVRTTESRSTYYQPVNATYKSPSAKLLNLTPGGTSGVHRRGVSPKGSFNSKASSQGPSPGPTIRPTSQVGISSFPSGGSHGLSPSASVPPLSGRLRVPSPLDAKDLFPAASVSIPASSSHGMHNSMQNILPTPPEESQLPADDAQLSATALPGAFDFATSSSTPSKSALDGPSGHRRQGSYGRRKMYAEQNPSSDDSHGFRELVATESVGGLDSHNSRNIRYGSIHESHHENLLLSPGNYEAETPQIANQRRVFGADGSQDGTPGLGAALQPPGLDEFAPMMPLIPTLDASKHHEAHSPQLYSAERPPRSVLMDELRLVQMETGSSTHWKVQDPSESVDHSESHESFCSDDILDLRDDSNVSAEESEHGSDISIPSGDPRKSIIHKRTHLTDATDAYSSLKSSLNFEELKLQEVIGGGGFGQVWKATWRGTPVAVKVLTGAAQNKHIARAILEEFKGEINLLEGMSHPHIVLYMGACLDPPNRAIVTELAANGSVWDALRLPLMPPYVSADGTQRGAWPLELYVPDHHGAPPSHSGMPRMSAPIPPKGSWPWQLVKRVACGAARGMAYLHSGQPPVLHRDLKSANLLLDESYTTKVCDFGLSRLKAQARSMTGNCGTVQWMAPEVLSNMNYDEKADVFSYGIILWELLSRECPYDGMTAIQCALVVLNRDKRPEIPKWCPPALHALIKSCVKKEPKDRPSFSQIILALDAIEA